MSWNSMPSLHLGDVVARIPIVQGGMGIGISRAGLASAVANAGGIGVIASVGLDLMTGKDRGRMKGASVAGLRQEIRNARRQTHGILGVNIMVAITDFTQLVDAAVDTKVDVIFIGAGLPLHFSENLSAERMKTMHTKIVPIVSSGRAAELIFQYWAKKYGHVPDGVVVEGPKAGGHLGFKKEHIFNPEYALENLIPQVVRAVQPFAASFRKQIPVIAAGGIFTGQDIYDIMQLGADGVQMATRFIATYECNADPAFKQAIIDAEEKDIMIINSPVGLPGRAVHNRFLDDVEAGVIMPYHCPYKCLKTCDFHTAPYCIAAALRNAQNGHLDQGFAFTGANAYRVKKMVTVGQLMAELEEGYSMAVDQVLQPRKVVAVC